MAVAINSLSDKAYARFIKEGMTPAGAASMLGNIFAESGMQAGICEYLCIQRLKEHGKYYTQESYRQAVDSGKISRAEFLNPLPGKQYGWGLVQWTTPTPRKSQLYDRTVAIRKSIADEDAQIEYLIYELKTRYQSVWSVLTTTTSIKEASDKVLKDFESPDNWSQYSSLRAGYGQEYYNAYATTTTKGSDTVAEQEIFGGQYISNSGSDENGRATGGKAGDQTQKEWTIRGWYNRPWDCVLRYPDINVARKISELAIKAARNDKIGYNQNNRNSYWLLLRSAGYDPAKITTPCDADCSAGVIANVKAVGYLLGITKLQNIWATYTGNMRQAFYEAGFQILSGNKFLTSPDYLLPGDILLNDVHHTATCVSTGIYAKKTTETTTPTTTPTSSTTTQSQPTSGKWIGIVNKNNAKARTWAGKKYDQVSFSPLKKGTKIEIQYSLKSAAGNDWYYFKLGDKYAFIVASSVDRESMIYVSGGTFNIKSNAELRAIELKNLGYTSIEIIERSGQYIVRVKVCSTLDEANNLVKELEGKGMEAVVVKV